MAAFIRNRPLLSYYVLRFALSWGGFLLVVGPGSLVVYVGAAQIGNCAAGESLLYAFGLAEAERRHDEKALTQDERFSAGRNPVLELTCDDINPPVG